MDKKRILIIVASLFILAGIGLIIFNAIQAQQPAKTESVSSQPLTGVSQNSDSGEGQQQNTDGSDSTAVVIPEKRTNPEILASITSQKPSLVDSTGKPIFAIVSSIKTQNAWYVVTLKDTQDATVSNVKIIMKDSGGPSGLVVIAGPGTKFDPEVIALPDEVHKLL